MTKVDIFSGFLGAGKTTLIKKLLAEALKDEKLVLIENEFGEIGIDGGFMQEAGIQVTEMNSGCICCSLVGDFGKALQKVVAEYAPDRILIEPSGVGKLSDVIRAVQNAGCEELRLNSFTAVCDASKVSLYIKNFGEFYLDQIEHAATVVMSHTDKVSDEKLTAAVNSIREHNAACTLVTAPLASLTGAQLLSAMEQTEISLADELKKLAEEEEICPVCGHHHHDDDDDDDDDEHEHHHHEHEHEHHHHEHEHHHHHHADEVFTSWGRETAVAFDRESLEKMLAALNDSCYGTVLRAKGIVRGKDGTWLHFDFVPGEADVRTGGAVLTGRLCVIGSKLNEEKLASLFGV